MSKALPDRTIRPNGKKIRALRQKKSWRLEDLAENAECSVKTISSVEAGNKVYRFTLKKIAKALDVEPHKLFYHRKDRSEPEGWDAFPRGSTIVVITTNLQFDEVDEAIDLRQFLRELSEAITATTSPDVLRLRAGSVQIELLLVENDALRLLCAFKMGRLSKFGIERLSLEATAPTDFSYVWDHIASLDHKQAEKPAEQSQAQRRKLG